MGPLQDGGAGLQIRRPAVVAYREGGAGVQPPPTPPPRNSEGPPKSCPIVKTVKNC